VAEVDFDAFFRARFDGVVRALTVATGDRGAAEEAAQEAFARALRRWPRVSRMERPGTWVYVVAVNVLRRSFRDDERLRSPAAALVAPEGAGPDHAGAVVTGVTLEAAVAQLPARQRLVVVLRHLAGLSTAEVADALGCAPGTVKSTLHAALARLRVELAEEDPT
jgi:RNA polymerase sigma-70 factor (ECF subfamily)